MCVYCARCDKEEERRAEQVDQLEAVALRLAADEGVERRRAVDERQLVVVPVRQPPEGPLTA